MKSFKKHLQELTEAKRYRFQDEIVTLAQLEKKAVGKELFTDGRSWNYNIVMIPETNKKIENLSESKLVDASKIIDDEDLGTFARNTLVFFMNAGFKTKIDQKFLSGVASLGGMEIEFRIGNENLFFEFPRKKQIFVKSASKEGIFALKKFLKVINNYGGQT